MHSLTVLQPCCVAAQLLWGALTCDMGVLDLVIGYACIYVVIMYGEIMSQMFLLVYIKLINNGPSSLALKYSLLANSLHIVGARFKQQCLLS